MNKTSLVLLALCLATTLAVLAAPTASAQACNFHNTGNWKVGIVGGHPVVGLVVLDCAVTPVIIAYD
jgi:hypothetical protein